MNRKDKLSRLRTLQAEVDTIREDLGLGRPNEVLYLACLDSDEEIVVVGDGFGAATASVVGGNYPIDFFTRYEKEFSSEAAAVRAAERVMDGQASPAEVLH